MTSPRLEDITPSAYKGVVVQNLNTSPIVISDLDGDNYDYTIAFWKTPTAGSIVALYPNGDTSANYRVYQMYGIGTTAAASTSESLDHGFIVSYSLAAGAHIPFSVMRITGESGGERHCQGLRTQSDGATPYLVANDIYWKNTVDNITSFTLKGYVSATVTFQFRLYRTAKTTSLKDYELVKEVDISSRDLQTNPIIFGGGSDTEGVEIDGDLYDEYVVETELDELSYIRLNGDTGSNYKYQILANSNGSLTASTTTLTSILAFENSTTRISTDKQYGNRVANGLNSRNFNNQQRGYSHWWLNSADNITEIRVLKITTTATTGKVKLFRKRPRGSFDGLPWELVKRHEFDGDFSSGYTFSNLDGDSTFLYKVKSGVAKNSGTTTTGLALRPNTDSGSNYDAQSLYGQGSSSVAAFSNTDDKIFMAISDQGPHTSICESILYPQSGYNRPMLKTINYETSSTFLFYAADWWINTGDNITSLNVYAHTNESVKGFVELYRIPLN